MSPSPCRLCLAKSVAHVVVAILGFVAKKIVKKNNVEIKIIQMVYGDYMQHGLLIFGQSVESAAGGSHSGSGVVCGNNKSQCHRVPLSCSSLF